MQIDPGSDAFLQCLMGRYQFIQPIISCPQNHQVSRICLNQHCPHYSLICHQKNCEACAKGKHKKCLKIQLDALTEMLEERAVRTKTFFKALCDIEDELIQKIQLSRKKMTQQFYLGDLEPKYQEWIDLIYYQHNRETLVGKQSKQLYDRLSYTIPQENELMVQCLETFKTQIHHTTQQVLLLKETLFAKLSASTKEPKNAEVCLLKPQPNTFQIDSIILKNPLTGSAQSQKQLLLTALERPKKLILLFRASEHGFRADKFHEICDKIPNTLTLVRTEFGKTIAAFTHYPWSQCNDWVSGEGQNAWLLSLDLGQKLVPQRDNYLIYCGEGCGPTFGEDLSIADKCHQNRKSQTNLPDTYNREEYPKYQKSQKVSHSFFGCQGKQGFTIKEYEVYRVIY